MCLLTYAADEDDWGAQEEPPPDDDDWDAPSAGGYQRGATGQQLQGAHGWAEEGGYRPISQPGGGPQVADSAVGAMPPVDAPLCSCGVPARELTSRSVTNPGRVFYKCAAQTCKYFQWGDEFGADAGSKQQPAQGGGGYQQQGSSYPQQLQPLGVGGGYGGYQAPPVARAGGSYQQEAAGGGGGAGGGAGPAQGGSEPQCGCGVPARELTSRSAANPGRVFYKCATQACKYFQWADELGVDSGARPAAAPRSPAAMGGSQVGLPDLSSCPSCLFLLFFLLPSTMA